MPELTEEQIEFIFEDVGKRGVSMEDLRDNLVDHICCIMEREWDDDEDFHGFYNSILPRFFKTKLKEIQEETDQLITFKYYYAMRNTLKISGIASALLTLIGATLKTMHLPGAGVMIVLGGFLFSLVFLPLMIVMKFRDEDKAVDKWVFTLGFILAIGTSMGFLFKVMHWPMANILMRSGITLFVFGYVPLYFLSRVRRVEVRFNTTVNTVLMMAAGGLLYAMFNLGYSRNISNSLIATHSFLIHQTAELAEANNKLYQQVPKEKVASDHYQASTKLFSDIEDTKVNLMALADEIPVEEARGLSIFDMKYPNNYRVVDEVFTHGDGPFSRQVLMQALMDYNKQLENQFPDQDEKQIPMDKLDLSQTTISLLVHELTQIQLQIAINQHSYLSYASAQL